MFNIQGARAGHTYTGLRHTNLLLCRRLAPSWFGRTAGKSGRVGSGRADALTLFCVVDCFLCLRKTTVSLLLWLAAVFCLAETEFLCFHFVCLTCRLIVVSLKVGGFWNFVASAKVCSFFRRRPICQESFFSDEQHLEGVNFPTLKNWCFSCRCCRPCCVELLGQPGGRPPLRVTTEDWDSITDTQPRRGGITADNLW